MKLAEVYETMGDPKKALGLVYHYLTSAMPDTALQQIFALVPSTVTRYRAWAMKILLNVLRCIPSGRISWWKDEDECAEDSALICARNVFVGRVFWDCPRVCNGKIDVTDLPLRSLDSGQATESAYGGGLLQS